MEIILAKTAGFCFGVNRAINTADALVKSNGCVYTLGPLIHNKQVTGELKTKGVYSIENIDELPEGKHLVIRSHGVPESTVTDLKTREIAYTDATCPFVTKIHNIIREESDKGSVVLIAGDNDHPEVIGIKGHCRGTCYIFKDLHDLEQNIINKNFLENCQISVVAQTTFDVLVWEKCLKSLKKVYTNVKIFDTICSATVKRQEEALKLAEDCDCMIIIGDEHSSNTNKLLNICKGRCPDSFLIESGEDIPAQKLLNAEKIGVTAGASTPARIIKEVLGKMSDILKTDTSEEMLTGEMNFEEMLEESLKSFTTNERLRGVVVGISPNEIYVDVGRKQAGYIPVNELSSDPGAKVEDIVKLGDELELLIMKTNDVEGTIMLSKKRVDAQKGWEILAAAKENNDYLDGKVVEVIKGGVIVLSHGIRVFVPASQATASRDDSLEALLNQNVKFRLLEIETKGRRRKVVGTMRSALKEQRSELKAKFWESVEVGKEYTGTVKSLTSYGAFVDIGGVDGMVHISELSWARVKHPSEVVNVGDTLNVYVKDIDTEKGNVSLGYKKDSENPWSILKDKYPEGTVINGKVVGMTAFGAFVSIIPGIDGLVHISQIANRRIDKPQDELSVGQKVEAKITGIDFDKKRVSLSIRALLPDAPVIDDTFPVAETAAEEVIKEEAEAAAQTMEAPVIDVAVAPAEEAIPAEAVEAFEDVGEE